MQIAENIFKKHSKAWIISGSVVGILLVAALIAFFILNAAINSPKILDGVTIGDVAVSNMSVEEAQTAVLTHYESALSEAVTLRCNDVEQTVSLTELEAEIDLEKTVQVAYEFGRNGSFFQRIQSLITIKNDGTNLLPVITCNDEALIAILQNISDSIDNSVQETTVELGDNAIIITKGIPGYSINIEAVATLFKNTILSTPDGIFNITAEEVQPHVPTASELKKTFSADPVDASYKIANQHIEYIEHQNGVKFDANEAQKIIAQTEGNVITIPVEVIPATVTIDKLKATMFTDLLGTYSSRYDGSNTSRSHNVSLAAQKINEIILTPGDVFSYNDVVGPRTTARGFRVANVYVGNRIEPGVGGGICQVSSTLFNAVVLADLKIVTRKNHSLPVSYVPLGRDATVSYGSIDFKFSNSTKNPVKIVASASGGINTVSVYGIKDNKNRTIEMSTECLSTSGPKVVREEDPTLPAGTVQVKQKGSSGSTYNTYKIIKENGKVVKTEFLTKSVYVPGERIEVVGTGGQEGTDATTPEATNPDLEAQTPVAVPQSPAHTIPPQPANPSGFSVPPTASEPVMPPVVPEPQPTEAPAPEPVESPAEPPVEAPSVEIIPHAEAPVSDMISNPAA